MTDRMSTLTGRASRPAPCPTLTFDPVAIPAAVRRGTRSARGVIRISSHRSRRCSPWPPTTTSRRRGAPRCAPSSLAIYTTREQGIPGWADSLLVPGMIHGAAVSPKALRRRQLRRRANPSSSSGRPIGIALWRSVPTDGRSTLATDNAGRTTGRDGAMTAELEHPGAIIRIHLRRPALSKRPAHERATSFPLRLGSPRGLAHLECQGRAVLVASHHSRLARRFSY